LARNLADGCGAEQRGLSQREFKMSKGQVVFALPISKRWLVFLSKPKRTENDTGQEDFEHPSF
jgi:hypothetical protein